MNAGETIPDLEKFLKWAAMEGNELLINIELKNDLIVYPGMEKGD